MIKRITFLRTEIPLTVPYKLSFGPVRHFDTFLACIELEDGRIGWGETTVLTGYTDETVKETWENGHSIAKAILNQCLKQANATAYEFHHKAPFAVTTFMTALDMAMGHDLLTSKTIKKVPLLAIVSKSDPAKLEQEVDVLLSEGFDTLKFKVGFDLAADLAALVQLQSIVSGRAKIRVDANQGFSVEEAVSFLQQMSPQNIELVEQPCAAGDWDAAVEIAKHTQVPLMLDESIYGLDDIRRAADLECAAYIKLKLMKFCSLDKLCEALELIRNLGMVPVLGNGVASDIGCWMETCVAAKFVDTAGEMNGFLKPVSPVFHVPMRVEGGQIIIEPGKNIEPNWEKINKFTVESREFKT